MPSSAEKLRELASWYREFAERTANPTIWEARLHTADDLDAEADRLEAVCRKQQNISIERDGMPPAARSSIGSAKPAGAIDE